MLRGFCSDESHVGSNRMCTRMLGNADTTSSRVSKLHFSTSTGWLFSWETTAGLQWKDTSTNTLLLMFPKCSLTPSFWFHLFPLMAFPLCLYLSICVLLPYCSNYSHSCSLLSLCPMLLGSIINVIPNGFLACRVWPLGRMKTRSIANKLSLREMVPKHTGLEN